MSSDFHFLVPESFHTKFGSDRHSILGEHPVQIFVCKQPWAKVKNDPDLQYSDIFIYSIRCLLLLTFRSLAEIVSEKSIVSLFLIEKQKLPNLTLQ